MLTIWLVHTLDRYRDDRAHRRPQHSFLRNDNRLAFADAYIQACGRLRTVYYPTAVSLVSLLSTEAFGGPC
jgi:hypothetical protein